MLNRTSEAKQDFQTALRLAEKVLVIKDLKAQIEEWLRLIK